MFQFAAFAPRKVTQYELSWVAPFGNLGLIGSVHLAQAYRSLARPSSPLLAKSSTVYPYVLDQYSYKLFLTNLYLNASEKLQRTNINCSELDTADEKTHGIFVVRFNTRYKDECKPNKNSQVFFCLLLSFSIIITVSDYDNFLHTREFVQRLC